MDNRTFIFYKIERVACECASESIGVNLSATKLYEGKKRTTLAISVARQLAFLFMHDNFGISYRRISEHSKMTINSVMKCVRKAREYRFSDIVYKKVYKLIEERL